MSEHDIAWAAERPDPETPDVADALGSATSGTTSREPYCTCSLDPAHDAHHNCPHHPPF